MTLTGAPRAPLAPGPVVPAPPLVRVAHGRVLAGVSGGLARTTGLPLAVVRAAFVLLAVAGGAGAAAYAVFWVFLPQDDGATLREELAGRARGLGVLALGAALVVALLSLGLLPGGRTTLPLVPLGAGVVLVWQQADVAQRRRWRATATATPGAAARLGLGGLLLVVGLVGFLASRGQLAVARAGLLSTLVVVAGLVLVSSPWWFALLGALREERTERIRSQERAEVAAHLHDSVLQTLALIQRSAASPAEVTRLARGQERELRSWLYADRARPGTLSAAMQAVADEVEQVHGVPVELVQVGDAPLDERAAALVAAAREAVVNAARHAGAPVVDVYAEAEPRGLAVYVRDRGRGFDPAAVPDDRHGLSGSVVGRMARHGGAAQVRSAPGEGTEVRLELPRG